ADDSMRSMASNPLFLGLLCEYIAQNEKHPDSTFVVYESYIDERLTRDRDRLLRRFNLEPTDLREAAERLAFSMTADNDLGLNPTREDLRRATERQSLSLGDRFNVLLSALEFLKLARSETSSLADETKPFSFSHRRFQEYFTTSVVLKNPDRVSPVHLLSDGRWRETAVVLMQTTPFAQLQDVIAEAQNMLDNMLERAPRLVSKLPQTETLPDESDAEEKELDEIEEPRPFLWPAGLMHLLNVLQEGFRSRYDELPDSLRHKAGLLLWSAKSTGFLTDEKWSLEIAGIVPQPTLVRMLSDGFRSSSLVRDVAFQQVKHLKQMTEQVSSSIRETLVKKFLHDQFLKEVHTLRIHLRRLDQAEEFQRVLKWLESIPFWDLVINLLFAFYILLQFSLAVSHNNPIINKVVFIYVLTVIVVYLSWYSLFRRGNIGFSRYQGGRTKNLALLSGVLLASSIYMLVLSNLVDFRLKHAGKIIKSFSYIPETETYLKTVKFASSGKVGAEELTILMLFIAGAGLMLNALMSAFVWAPIKSYAQVGANFRLAFKRTLVKIKNLLPKNWKGIVKLLFSIKNYIRAIAVLVAAILTLALMGAGVFFIILAIINILKLTGGPIFLTILSGLFLWPFVAQIIIDIKEYFWVHLLFRDNPDTYNVQGFLNTLERIHIVRHRVYFINNVRQKNLLRCTGDDRELIEQLIARIELDAWIYAPFRKSRNVSDFLEISNSSGWKFKVRLAYPLLALLERLRRLEFTAEFLPSPYKRLLDKLLSLSLKLVGLEQNPLLMFARFPKANPDHTASERFVLWYQAYVAEDPFRLAFWARFSLLDELCLLMEQYKSG
ncbi:MAG: hypothetical protein KC415_08885, partial [Anaerolineales bacterium]|nr:hypothetical protein [Anaerolineales bacterium]